MTVPDELAGSGAASPGELEIDAQELCECILTELKLIISEQELREATGESEG